MAAVSARTPRPTEGAALVRFRPRIVKRTYRESDPKRVDAAAPWTRGWPQRRFQPQRLNCAQTPGRRVSLNATPANCVSAATSDRTEKRNARPSELRRACALYLLQRRMGEHFAHFRSTWELWVFDTKNHDELRRIRAQKNSENLLGETQLILP
jgi:hypothetical protein